MTKDARNGAQGSRFYDQRSELFVAASTPSNALDVDPTCSSMHIQVQRFALGAVAHDSTTQENIPGRRGDGLAVATEVETTEVDRVQSGRNGPQASTSAATAISHQHRRQPLREETKESKLPNVQHIEGDNAVQVPPAGREAVDGAEGWHKRQGAVLLTKCAAAALSWVLLTDKSGGQLRIKCSNDVAVNSADAHQGAGHALVLHAL